MKKCCVLIVLCFVLLLSACTTPQPSLPSNQHEDVQQQTHYLIHTSERISVSIGFPCLEEQDAWLSQTMLSYLHDTIERVIGERVELTESVDKPQNLDYAEVVLEMNYQITDLSDLHSSIVFSGTLREQGAAHPSGECFALNLDTRNQKQVFLRDICPVDDALYDTFLDCACQVLTDKGSTNHTKENVAELFPKEEFLLQMQEETIYQSYFTQDGVGIICPAGHALGDYLRVEIPLETES